MLQPSAKKPCFDGSHRLAADGKINWSCQPNRLATIANEPSEAVNRLLSLQCSCGGRPSVVPACVERLRRLKPVSNSSRCLACSFEESCSLSAPHACSYNEYLSRMPECQEVCVVMADDPGSGPSSSAQASAAAAPAPGVQDVQRLAQPAGTVCSGFERPMAESRHRLGNRLAPIAI